MERPAPATQGVLRKDRVRVLAQPALIDCSGAGTGHGTGAIAVVPLLDGDRLAGLEIRCACGATAVVECVWQPEVES